MNTLKISTPVFWSLSLVCLAAALGSGCSSAQKNFEKVMPGMSTSQVQKEMNGPTRFEQVASDYSAWYWNTDYCVLFKDDKVISKDSSQTGRNASIAGGQYEEKHIPQCLAPGQTATASTSRTIKIPGVGTVELPKSQLRAPSSDKDQ